jgi:hypothetical protein
VLYPNKPTLTATENEYLLFIHPEIKERAKVIRGYRWDPERRCWVYPRTKQVWDALVAEFGEEIGKAAKVRPAPAQAAPSAQALQARIEELERDNAGLREALNQSVDIMVDTDLERADLEQAGLRSQLEETRSQLVKVRSLAEAEIADLRREAKGAEARRQITEAELTAARDSLVRLQRLLSERAASADCFASLKAMALEATGNDSGFAPVLDTLDLSNNLPLKAGRLLEDQLRLLLKIPERQRNVDLYDLIR